MCKKNTEFIFTEKFFIINNKLIFTVFIFIITLYAKKLRFPKKRGAKFFVLLLRDCKPYLTFARIALSIARTATPTSPKTAIHIFAIPRAERMSIATLTASAKIMFS